MREHFTLEPGVTFLNHGSFGACPRVVLDEQTALRARLEREPVRFFLRELEPLLDRAREALSHFLGAPASELAFVPNTTHAVSEVLRSLPLKPGDELVTTSHAYNACANALRFVADRSQATLVVAQVPFPIDSSAAHHEAVLQAVTKRTRLVLVDHVTSPSGLLFDLGPLVQELERRGVPVFVDGAHAPGMVPLELSRLGASFYAGNLHKWVCAPKGAAFLHVRAEHHPWVRPLAISHGFNATRTDRSRFHLEHDWVGTVDPTAFLCVPTALECLAGLVEGGWPAVRRRNHALAVEGRALLLDVLGTDVPAPPDLLGSLASVLLRISPAAVATKPGVVALDPLQDWLWEQRRIEVPVFSFGGRRVLRISAQLYNQKADYERLALALSEAPRELT